MGEGDSIYREKKNSTLDGDDRTLLDELVEMTGKERRASEYDALSCVDPESRTQEATETDDEARRADSSYLLTKPCNFRCAVNALSRVEACLRGGLGNAP